MDEGDLAWIGFKVVYDAAEACRNTDNEVTKKYGDVGSADGEPLVFFCNARRRSWRRGRTRPATRSR